MRILDELKEAFGSVAEARQAALSGKAEDLARVISFLLREEEWKAQFFVKISGALVFNKERFLQLLENRELDSSYTKFSNKIGLGLKGKRRFLRAQDDVVLNFPYKDCVLKGAQGEDGAKTHELFFNEILAAAEIDALFRPKSLCNFELVSSVNAEDVNLLDELKSSRVNLLLKGNNLLALHTLKRRRDICGNVKLIYIDPPYNTGSDSFNYNDRFSHSTWLAFMKNRLEAAREFLRGDGAIFIQCDDNEQAYLKVLCDEIFGRENFVTCITCKVKAPSGVGSGKEAFFDCAEYILCYAKNKPKWSYKVLKIDTSIVGSDCDKTKDNYSRIFKKLDLSKKKRLPNAGNIFYLEKQDYEIAAISRAERTRDFYFKNIDRIFRTAPAEEKRIRGIIADSRVECDLFIVEKENGADLIYKNEDVLMLKKFCRIDEKNKAAVKMDYLTNIFTDDFWQGISQEGQVRLKNGKKPEALLKRIIEISTNEGDLVMDFFAGSGTTLAVAHKMRRRWVGVEQMDYIEAITKERLKKVVAGEQGGVSKATGWHGGGRFVYAELAPLNAGFKEKIARAGEDELAGIYEELEEKAFLDYRVDFCEMLQDADFASLPLEEKKRALIDALDSNMDYVLLSDLDDEDLGIDEETRERNRAFFV